MRDFSIHHRSAKSPAGWAPKTGELVSAQFTEDDQWYARFLVFLFFLIFGCASPINDWRTPNRYRAKVRRASAMRKEAELVFID
jgi:staphylococcal nuclease domain-containing protein 1